MSTRFRIAAAATLIVLLGLAVLGHAGAASPIVAADSVTTAINKTVEFDVLKNDPQSAVLVDHTEPASGLLTIQTNARLRYLPNANFTGADGFTYRAQMITGEIQTATVSITVTGEVTAVEARNDSLVTDEDTPVFLAERRSWSPSMHRHRMALRRSVPTVPCAIRQQPTGRARTSSRT